MSLNQFITNILNIKSEQIQELLTLNQSVVVKQNCNTW